MAAPDLYDLLVKQGIMTQAQADAARAAANKPATTTSTATKPTTTVYPTVSSSTDATALINKVFQSALKRDASAAELKYWKPLLAAAQKANGAQQSYTIKGKTGTQTTITGLNDEVWLEGQLASNTAYKKDLPKVDYAAELNAVKITDPALFTRMQEKKTYVDAITSAAGDQAKIDSINESTTYGRGLSELLSNIQALAESYGATNTPEELAKLATKLYDKGIPANSTKAAAEIDAVFKTAAGLIKNQPADLVKRAADKKIYDKLIAEAGTDAAKIQNVNETTAYGRGLQEILATIQSKAEESGATNTPEELTNLAKTLYDKGTLITSSAGKAALDTLLKTSGGLVKGQSATLVQRIADKKIYDDLIKAAAGNPDKIKAANETTDYGRGLSELTAAIQSKAKSSNATNTPEELATLAKTLYDKGILLESAEGKAQLDSTLKADNVLVKDQQTDLVKIAADKKIYETQLAAAGDDPAKIQKVMDTTAYGRGLKELLAAIQTRATDNGAINTPEELKALAQSLYDKGTSLNSAEGLAAVNAVLKTKNGLVKDQPVDLVKLAADKAIYDKLITAANGDATAIAKAKATTAYGRGLTAIEASLAKFAANLGATNDPTELATLAQDLYNKGINPSDAEGQKQINSVLKYGVDSATGKYKGTAGTTIADLQKTAAANGLDLQKNFGDKIAGWITAINSGEQIDNIKQQIRDVAKLGQPDSVKKLIDNGTDLTTIYAPYRNTMASTLEIQDPNSINLNDPTLRMAITPTGEMNLYDYTKALRKDNRWQYTQSANQEVASTTQKVLRDFGFMG